MPLIESIGSATIYLSVATLLVGYYTYKWFIYPFYFSPMCKIPGPPPENFLLGNIFSVLNFEVRLIYIFISIFDWLISKFKIHIQHIHKQIIIIIIYLNIINYLLISIRMC